MNSLARLHFIEFACHPGIRRTDTMIGTRIIHDKLHILLHIVNSLVCVILDFVLWLDPFTECTPISVKLIGVAILSR